MTRDELVAMVRRIQSGDYASEADGDRLLDEDKQGVPGPGGQRPHLVAHASAYG